MDFKLRASLHKSKVETADNPILKIPHFAIVQFAVHEVHHDATEGDERSRTNPGHGYPAQAAYTERIPVTYYYAFASKDAWEEAVRGLYMEDQNRKDICAFEVSRVANPQVQVTVSL